MSRRLIVRPEAESDIVEVALWYESREAGLGFAVTTEIRAAIKNAVEYPRAHLLLRRHPEVHRVLARRFPYRIFYIVRLNAIVVFAVLHTAQDDRHWKRRL